MTRLSVFSLCLLTTTFVAPATWAAVKSAELYTGSSYQYGRFEARLKFGAGDGVVSSFFLWKDGSEKSGTFWNELDFEKLGADCHLQTNAYFGNPASVHNQTHAQAMNLCTDFHTYAYEWTPDYISWLIDGVELRRETGATATAYAENATAGMQIRFNIWPGDATFGGNFSPAILPVKEQIDWVQYSSFADGAFKVEWRDDFEAATLGSNWLSGNWGSPKNLSTHDPGNIAIVDGNAVLSLTGDSASGGASGSGGSTGTTPTAGAGQAPGGSSDGCSVRPSRGNASQSPTALLAFATLLTLFRRRKIAAR